MGFHPLDNPPTNVPLDRSNASKKVCSAEPNACVHSVLGPLWRSRRRVKVSSAPFLIVPRRRGLSFNAVRNLDPVVCAEKREGSATIQRAKEFILVGTQWVLTRKRVRLQKPNPLKLLVAEEGLEPPTRGL